MCAGAAGAWAPLWLGVAAGLVGVVLERSLGRRAARALADVAVVAICCVASMPAVSLTVIVSTGAFFAAVGLAIDVVAANATNRTLVWAWALPAVAVVGFTVWQFERTAPWLLRTPFLAAAPEPKGRTVRLTTGASAIVDRPRGDGPFPGALFFHGSDKAGAHQPATVVARRALLHAGFLVVSLDHPGFGDSPIPSDFDPLPSILAAYDLLVQERVDGIIAVGHSMGCSDVLLLLTQERRIESAVLIGAGVREDPDDERWYRRFHDRRGLHVLIGREAYDRVWDSYYDQAALAARLPAGHAPIVFTRLELEHADLARTQPGFYESIMGAKRLWDVEGATHGLSSTGRQRVVVGDTRVTRRLAQHFGSLLPFSELVAEGR